MFRILIVEDNPIMLSSMKDFLGEALRDPDDRAVPQIDTASDVQAARRLIERAVVTKHPYHAIVLDMMLPPEPGLRARFDESLCNTLHALMPSALVAHITAYAQDEQVKWHVQKQHTELVDRSIVLAKNQDLRQVLCDKLKAFLFGLQVEERMHKVFGSVEADVGPLSRIQRRPQGAGSLTHELAALCRQIAGHWNDLDEPLRVRVRTVFYVDDTKEPVRVSLLHPRNQS